MTSAEIGSLFKKARIDKKMTQKEVADCLSYSAQNVSLWEVGKVLPKMDSVFDFCSVLKIDPELFLSGYIIPDGKELKFDNEKFLSILKSEATRRNISKKQLESWLCVSRPTLNRILKGEIVVNISQFLTLNEEFASSFVRPSLFQEEKSSPEEQRYPKKPLYHHPPSFHRPTFIRSSLLSSLLFQRLVKVLDNEAVFSWND